MELEVWSLELEDGGKNKIKQTALYYVIVKEEQREGK